MGCSPIPCLQTSHCRADTAPIIFAFTRRPGDTVSGVVNIVDADDPESRLQHHDISFGVPTHNDSGEDVLTIINHGMVTRRDYED